MSDATTNVFAEIMRNVFVELKEECIIMTDEIISALERFHPTHVRPIAIDKIVMNAELRKMCEMNTCGMCGKNYMCPPYIGSPSDCMEKIKRYSSAYVVQNVFEIEDPYDFEGMMASQDVHVRQIKEIALAMPRYLVLGAGPCTICHECALLSGKPCRAPTKAISSVEAHCIDVNNTLLACGLTYNNGESTVSYVGMVLIP